jgi:hypothetical protein
MRGQVIGDLPCRVPDGRLQGFDNVAANVSTTRGFKTGPKNAVSDRIGDRRSVSTQGTCDEKRAGETPWP